MANAIMFAIPPEKAGVGAGVNGTLTEFGNGLGVAVPAAARTDADRAVVADAFSTDVQTSQLAGAAAVFVGGVLAALLLRRAERADAAPPGPEAERGVPVGGRVPPGPDRAGGFARSGP